MDNPWATAWDQPRNPHDKDTSTSWSTPGWPAVLRSDAPWDPSASATAQDQLPDTEPHSATAVSVSDHQSTRSISPPRDSSDVSETTDATCRNVASDTCVSGGENLDAVLNPPDVDWSIAWDTTPPSNTHPRETQPPDQWEAALQEKEKLSRAVPPELLDSLLRHCQRVSQEIWPAPETDEDNWRTGFDEHADITALLARLLPINSTLPPAVQFSATTTAKAMNEALKLTRHLPAAASSPLSRLLASKGSLEWERSIKTQQDIVPDTAHVGWRVLEKEDRLNTLEESKTRRVTSSLLSFWNRRTSAIQAASVEIPRERSSSPARSSLESIKPPHPPSSRAPSPSKTSTTCVQPPPLTDSHPTVVATAPAPSAVSRFLNRFSRVKGAQHSALALSSDDLEFLCDIVPSASDPLDEDVRDGTFDALTGASSSSPLPPKLPPPIPPPPKQPILSSHPSSVLGFGTSDGVSATGSAPAAFQMQTANHTPNVPVLVPPLSPKSKASFSRSQSPPLYSKDVATSTVASTQSRSLSIRQILEPSSQPNLRPNSSFTLLPPQKALPILSIPPLLPPPPISPPRTPRPSTFPSITPGDSSTMRNTDASSFHNSYDSDDEFSAFTSFPPSTPAPFPSSVPYPSRGPPSPPSPPPRRSYERTHYPSSSSTSSILSPASHSSLDQLYSTRSSISASLDNFDDFVSPVGRKRTPSPPPLPVKPQLQRQQPLHLDTFSRVYHAHTSSQTFASPTVHTSLMHSAFSGPSVSDEEHQRTQSLVNQAAARGGMLWPNSPDIDEPQVKAIPPPPSTSTSPKPLIGQESFDLLGDSDVLGSNLEGLPASRSVVGMGSKSPTMNVSQVPFGVGDGLGSRNQLQPSPPPLPSTSVPSLSFSSLSIPAPLAATNSRSSQATKPKQIGGLSAQDLSFFEGL